MNKQNVSILADSLNVETGDRLTTFLLHRFPKCLLAEAGTRRILSADGMDEPITERLNPFGQEFSRNAASSRAIPIEKVIQLIKADPYIPAWTANQKGMQGALIDDEELKYQGDREWLAAMDNAISSTISLMRRGIHKQNANRLLEPFMRVPVIVSGTEWKNFFNLRCDEATHPDFRAVARDMAAQWAYAKPAELRPGEWHIPFGDKMPDDAKLIDKLKIATARGARLSYATHDGVFSYEKDYGLHDGLKAEFHMSPFEHCAVACGEPHDNYPGFHELPPRSKVYTRNYRGFYSYRAQIEDGVQP